MRYFLSSIVAVVAGTVYSQPHSSVNQVDSEGRKQGVWKKAYPRVQTYRYVGQFKDDQPYGKFTYYYEDGAVEAVIDFREEGKVSYHKNYHPSGYLMACGKYLHRQKDSVWLFYNDRGLIRYQVQYKSGKREGQKIHYHTSESGEAIVVRREHYQGDTLSGSFSEYYPNGRIKTEGNYASGQLDGTVKHYYANGKLKKLLRYKNKAKDGFWLFYGKDGKKVGDQLYCEGRLLEGAERERRIAEMKRERSP